MNKEIEYADDTVTTTLHNWENGDFFICEYIEIEEGKAIRLDLDDEY